MLRSFHAAFSSIVLLIFAASAVPARAHHLERAATTSLPVTTSSSEARDLYQKGMADLENLYVERSLDDWRAAAKLDPNFGLAWVWIAFESGNPEEATSAREKAKSVASK